VVVVTSPRYGRFLIARVDVAVGPVLSAVEIKRLTGAVRLLCQMVGISKFSSGRQLVYANNLIDLFIVFLDSILLWV
jgi:hypothetical protein